MPGRSDGRLPEAGHPSSDVASSFGFSIDRTKRARNRALDIEAVMPEDTFQHAVKRARLQYGLDRWDELSATEQSRAIYRQLRILDMRVVGLTLGSREPVAGSFEPDFDDPD